MRRYIQSTLLMVAVFLAACAPVGVAPVAVGGLPSGGQVLVRPAELPELPVVQAAVAVTPAAVVLPALPPESCPVTTAPAPAFALPTGAPSYEGYFWYGTAALWTELPTSGAWGDLPHDGGSYGQKLFFGRDGYSASDEQQPDLVVTGRRLDAGADRLAALRATNGYQAEVGNFMLVGGNFPAAGCWEVTATYRGPTTAVAAATLIYVVWIAP